MPLHSNHPPVGVVALDTLNDAIVGASADADRTTQTIDSLMVNRVHAE